MGSSGKKIVNTLTEISGIANVLSSGGDSSPTDDSLDSPDAVNTPDPTGVNTSDSDKALNERLDKHEASINRRANEKKVKEAAEKAQREQDALDLQNERNLTSKVKREKAISSSRGSQTRGSFNNRNKNLSSSFNQDERDFLGL